MQLTKKHYIIIGIVVAIIAVWYFFLRKKKTESAYTTKRNKLLGTGNAPYNPNRMTAATAGTGVAIPNCPVGQYWNGTSCADITQMVDPGPGGFGGGSAGNWGKNVKR